MTSWFRKLISGAKPAPGVATRQEPTSDDRLVEMERFIGGLVAGGYETPQQILDSVSDYMGDDLDARTIALEAGPMLERALIAHEAAAKTWPAVTDYDRLHRAFAALEDRGITARENFSCCGTCGSSEIWGEMDEARSSGAKVTGYVFFHMQDTEAATDGGDLYLNYGAMEEGEIAALHVAATIVSELERNGLNVDWDGSWGTRIGVKLEWKRRREHQDTRPSSTLH
jgi:hypothetical protein